MRQRGYITVDVDVADVLDEIDDDDLAAEYEERGLGKKVAQPVGLVELVEERHTNEHPGSIACCADALCDAVYRAEVDSQRGLLKVAS